MLNKYSIIGALDTAGARPRSSRESACVITPSYSQSGEATT